MNENEQKPEETKEEKRRKEEAIAFAKIEMARAAELMDEMGLDAIVVDDWIFMRTDEKQ